MSCASWLAVVALLASMRGPCLAWPLPLSLTAAELSSAAQRLSRFIQFKTVSARAADNHALYPDEWAALHAWLPTVYPRVWSALDVEQVGSGNYSLLLTWHGQNTTLEPILWIGHMDVVPAANETLGLWTHSPFSGTVLDGYVWGRGAIDDKVGVLALLEAVDRLLALDWVPGRTMLFGFGHDEEVGGWQGAHSIAKHLRAKGVTTLDAVIDEGSMVQVDGFRPYTTKPVALIGTAEKGYYTVKVRLSGWEGHSSLPPIDRTTVSVAIGKLLTALDAHQPAAALVAPVTDMLKALAPIVNSPELQALFKAPHKNAQQILDKYLLVDTALTASLARTTAAVTGVVSFVAENLLPPTADIIINFRLLPGYTPAMAEAYLTDVLDSAGLQGQVGPLLPDSVPKLATEVTPSAGRHYHRLKRAVEEMWDATDTPITVAPLLLAGGTDSGHYSHMTRNGILRFVPISSSSADEARVHGVNERVSLNDLARAILVYQRALQRLTTVRVGKHYLCDVVVDRWHAQPSERLAVHENPLSSALPGSPDCGHRPLKKAPHA